MQKELTFSGDCILTFDDIGQLKDYSDIVEQLVSKTQTFMQQHVSDIEESLLEVIQADPEDTFFLPTFQQLLRNIAAIDWLSCHIKQDFLNAILKFQLLVVEECLLSFTFGQDILNSFVSKCLKYQKQEHFQELLLWTLFRLSDKFIFIEQSEVLATLWSCIDERTVISTTLSKEKGLYTAMYLECCQKFTRSRKVRQELIKLCSDKLILQIKIAIVNMDKQKGSQLISNLAVEKSSGSEMVEEMISHWMG